MARFNCFSAFIGGWKKKSQEDFDAKKGQRTLQVKLEHGNASFVSKDTSFDLPVPFEVVEDATCNVKVLREESSQSLYALDVAYEGEDEHDEKLSMTRGFSDSNLQSNAEEHYLSSDEAMNVTDAIVSAKANSEDAEGREEEMEVVQSGHVSDPGIAKLPDWESPKLVRSCSNLESKAVFEKVIRQLPPSNSYDDLGNLGGVGGGEFTVPAIHRSPSSVRTTMSADKVVLKKGSSSNILPSRSRKLWWKLFLMSHRNLHRLTTAPSTHQSVNDISKQTYGYCSDTLEASQATVTLKNDSSFREENGESPWSFSDELPSKNLQNAHMNQWIAFSSESSSLSRVDEWVNVHGMQPVIPPDDADCDETDTNIFYPPSPPRSTQPIRHSNGILSEDIVQANSVVNSLNTLSAVAHISGMGLKVIPHISPFVSLKSVNLSGNFIVHIIPGSLPKGLHTLDLSRNKIATIEGLRDLTRLRVLNLSYNRISKIGHGLSSCILIKELYLAGNKISDAEGLHRLLKLAVLDLSFNKITTTRALGQLVANYNSLLAVNVLGNPIQGNLSEEQLKKTMSGLLPQLTYLNKQQIKPQRGREVASNSVAKAALGDGGWNSRRKPAKKTSSRVISALAKSRAREGSSHRSQYRAKTSHHRSPTRR